MIDLTEYKAKSGGVVPVRTIEVQTLPEDTDRILDEVKKVHPLSFDRYQRNASISAIGPNWPEAAYLGTKWNKRSMRNFGHSWHHT